MPRDVTPALLRELGARARKTHEDWLNRAIHEPEGTVPRIPRKRADFGGWERLLATPTGRRRAERWWEVALARVPLIWTGRAGARRD